MIKLFGLLVRRDDLTLAQFSQHWRTVHRELALRLVPPGFMRGYVQNHRLPGVVIPGAKPPCDGVPEVWIDSPGMLERLATSTEYLEGAGPDEPNFMQGGAGNCLTNTEATSGASRASVATRLKVMVFFRQGSSLAGDAASSGAVTRSWLMPDAKPLRYERERCLTDVSGVPASPYVAIESTWWTDHAAFESAWMRRVTAATPEREFEFEAMAVEDLQVFLPGSAV